MSYSRICKYCSFYVYALALIPLLSIILSAGSDKLDNIFINIHRYINDLKYSYIVYNKFVNSLDNWKDNNQRSYLITLYNMINTRDGYSLVDNIYDNSKYNASIMLAFEVQDFYDINESTYDLNDIIDRHQANCLGISQVYYILGNALGLKVDLIEVSESLYGMGTGEASHVACLAYLSDNTVVMIDLTINIYSMPFNFKTYYRKDIKDNNYWNLRDGENDLRIHKRIRILDNKGIISMNYLSKMQLYVNDSYDDNRINDKRLILCNKAIEYDDKNAIAYSFRGGVYGSMKIYDKAFDDSVKASKLDERSYYAYALRGNIYMELKCYKRAIIECDKALAINDKYAMAYYIRAYIYMKQRNYTQALKDIDQSIKYTTDQKILCNNYIVKKMIKNNIEFNQKIYESYNEIKNSCLNKNPQKYRRLRKLIKFCNFQCTVMGHQDSTTKEKDKQAPHDGVLVNRVFRIQ
jgi:tetratricopeptide (TPR) repeat protein